MLFFWVAAGIRGFFAAFRFTLFFPYLCAMKLIEEINRHKSSGAYLGGPERRGHRERGTQRLLHPYGYFVWIPPEKSHRISFEDKKIKLLNVYCPTELADCAFFDEVGVYPMPSILYHVMELIEGQTAEYLPSDWRYDCWALPCISCRTSCQPNASSCACHPIIHRIMDKIQKEYQQELTAQHVAEACGLSVRTLSRYLRSKLDVNFVQYVRTYWVLMAIKKMVKAEDSITNFAYSVGYDSLTAFSNSFY